MFEKDSGWGGLIGLWSVV